MVSVFGHDLEALLEGGDQALVLLRGKIRDAVAGATLINKEDLNKLYIEFSAMKAIVKELANRAAQKEASPDK